jgi:hypothetical protein
VKVSSALNTLGDSIATHAANSNSALFVRTRMRTPSGLFFAANIAEEAGDWSAPRNIGAQYRLDVDDRCAVDRFEAAHPDPR